MREKMKIKAAVVREKSGAFSLEDLELEEPREDTLLVHVTLVPVLDAVGEPKTKPTQHSVKELRSIGIQPDILLCRTDRYLSQELKAKIAL